MKKTKDIKKPSIKRAIGLAFILFSILGLVNVGYISQTITIIMTFIFGFVGYWIIYPFLFMLGLYFFITAKKEISKRKFNYLIGISIVLFSTLIIASVFVYFPSRNDVSLDVFSYNQLFYDSWLRSTRFPFSGNGYMRYFPLETSLGGGYFGYLFAGLINTIPLGPIGTLVSSFVLLVIALIVLLIKPISFTREAHKDAVKSSRELEEKKRLESSSVTADNKAVLANDNNTVVNNINTNNEIKSTPIIDGDSLNSNESNANVYADDTPPELDPMEDLFTQDGSRVALITPSGKVKEVVHAEENNEEDDSKTENNDSQEVNESLLPPYVFPSYDLLKEYPLEDTIKENEDQAMRYTDLINNTLNDLKIGARVVGHTIGPRVTRYDLQLDANATLHSIPQYVPDIAQRVGGVATRFVPIVPGKMTSGLEIENKKPIVISFLETLKAIPIDENKPLLIPFGKNISGELIYANLAEFPHMLIAGSTGSGKSIYVHSILMTLIMRNNPSTLKLLLVDPKRVEFIKYKNSPFLLCPNVADPIKAKVALEKLCEEMDERYTIFENSLCSNIKDYNALMKEKNEPIMPYIVVVIDEFADLIMTNKKVDLEVNRIAAKARAAGIHMIVATQRPSVDVITGTVKANLPVRVALHLPNVESSKTILGGQGAESLLNNGDMLVSCPIVQSNDNFRCQACLVTNGEILKVVEFINNQRKPKYSPRFLDLEDHSNKSDSSLEDQGGISDDDLYSLIKKQVRQKDYISMAMLARENNISPNRAGKMFRRLIDDNIVSGVSEGSKGNRVINGNSNLN